MSNRETEQMPGGTETEDARLLSRVSAGDRDAWEALVSRHGDAAFAVLRSMLRSTQDAEDALQDTFIRIHRYAGSYKPDSHGNNARGWVVRVAARVALSMMSKRKTSEQHEAQVTPRGEEPEEARKAEKREAHELLRTAVRQLPEHLRVPVVLHFAGELSQRDIARELQCPRSTVADHIRQGLDRLRYRLNALGVSGVSALVPGAIGASVSEAKISKTLSTKLLTQFDSPAAASARATIVTKGASLSTPALVGACLLVALAGTVGVWWSGHSRVTETEPRPESKSPRKSPDRSKPLYAKWDFANGPASDLEILQGIWTWKKINGAGAMIADPDADTGTVCVLLPQRPSMKPLKITLDVTVRRKGEHSLDAVWVNERGTVPCACWSVQRTVSRLRCKREIFLLGEYAVNQINGKTSTIYRFEQARPGSRLTLFIKNWIVHEIQLRELDEHDAEVLAIDPAAQKQALLGQGATHTFKTTRPFKESVRGLLTP